MIRDYIVNSANPCQMTESISSSPQPISNCLL